MPTNLVETLLAMRFVIPRLGPAVLVVPQDQLVDDFLLSRLARLRQGPATQILALIAQQNEIQIIN